jgi:hypothetical protein
MLARADKVTNEIGSLPVLAQRQLLRRSDMSGVGGRTDSITDGLDQTLLG